MSRSNARSQTDLPGLLRAETGDGELAGMCELIEDMEC